MSLDAFVLEQSGRLDALCRALDGDDWELAATLSAEIESALGSPPTTALTNAQLESLASRHAAYLRSLVAARQRLTLVSSRMTGVQRAMRAYAHLNDQD